MMSNQVHIRESVDFVDISDPQAMNADIYGHKAASLSRIHQAGYSVPAATFLAPSFFGSFFATCEDNFAGERKQFSTLVDAIHACEMPQNIQQTLRSIGLQYSSMAVRSSSLKEDTKHASGAGQFSTVLG